jgi:hypothetical protein
MPRRILLLFPALLLAASPAFADKLLSNRVYACSVIYLDLAKIDGTWTDKPANWTCLRNATKQGPAPNPDQYSSCDGNYLDITEHTGQCACDTEWTAEQFVYADNACTVIKTQEWVIAGQGGGCD